MAIEFMPQAATLVHRLPYGEWPGTITDLPMILTEAQLAHVLGLSTRTLQRRRYRARDGGRPWIPHNKDGKLIIYTRNAVAAYYDLDLGRQAA